MTASSGRGGCESGCPPRERCCVQVSMRLWADLGDVRDGFLVLSLCGVGVLRVEGGVHVQLQALLQLVQREGGELHLEPLDELLPLLPSRRVLAMQVTHSPLLRCTPTSESGHALTPHRQPPTHSPSTHTHNTRLPSRLCFSTRCTAVSAVLLPLLTVVPLRWVLHCTMRNGRAEVRLQLLQSVLQSALGHVQPLRQHSGPPLALLFHLPALVTGQCGKPVAVDGQRG